MRWTVALLLKLVLVCGTEGQTMGPKKPVPDDSLFRDPSAFCEGCYGVMHELDKLMRSWFNEAGSLEQHIDAAILAVCSTDRLRAYVLSPPKMMRLCSGIRAHYEDELGMALLRHYSAKNIRGPDQLFRTVCYKAIPACPTGVQAMSIVRKEKMDKAAEEKRVKEEQEKQKVKEENAKASEEAGKKATGTKMENKKKPETKKDEL